MIITIMFFILRHYEVKSSKFYYIRISISIKSRRAPYPLIVCMLTLTLTTRSHRQAPHFYRVLHRVGASINLCDSGEHPQHFEKSSEDFTSRCLACHSWRKMQASISAITLNLSLFGPMHLNGRRGDQITVHIPCEVCSATSMVHLTCTP